jgi:hypothetical protein
LLVLFIPFTKINKYVKKRLEIRSSDTSGEQGSEKRAQAEKKNPKYKEKFEQEICCGHVVV